MEYVYKVMSNDDLSHCAKLFQKAFLKEPWYEEWTYQQAYQRLNQIMDSSCSIGFVIYDQDELIAMLCGRIMTYLDEEELWVEEICVSNCYQGKGLGSSLLEYTKQELLKRNVRRMTLNTVQGYLSDVFYQKNGFIKKDSIVCMKCDF